MTPEIKELLEAAQQAVDQMACTNRNLKQGMPKSIQRMQGNENREAEYRLRAAIKLVRDSNDQMV